MNFSFFFAKIFGVLSDVYGIEEILAKETTRGFAKPCSAKG
jgi:hypothetical protein